jgi:hypothetical protein
VEVVAAPSFCCCKLVPPLNMWKIFSTSFIEFQSFFDHFPWLSLTFDEFWWVDCWDFFLWGSDFNQSTAPFDNLLIRRISCRSWFLMSKCVDDKIVLSMKSLQSRSIDQDAWRGIHTRSRSEDTDAGRDGLN